MPTQARHTPDTDWELVRQARRGKDAAFDELVERHGRRLFGLAFSLLGNVADAEDAVQEAFAGALRGLIGFRGEAAVKTWLSRILVHKVANIRKSRLVRASVPIEWTDGSVADPSGGTATDRADVRMDFAPVVMRLSEEHRDVVVLREVHGMSYEEIAELLGVPRGTVQSRLFRARRELKRLLRDYLT